ncbi:hypothetical protein FXO38_01463 [Capsicum annuum]|uniref:uncharacterized protein LOC107854380 n=1 Tax=Capsicum annuum TaxID=4072 RepID=UPI0007BEBDB4|nr:uncharacterized protein LOC107854380 [Capsicum annuum]KAF3682009.1 hypothetical protein FXO38_01463 [Capsicum annuum]
MAPSPPEEDFSFPTITNTPPRFLESPPLWRTTSVASSRLQKTASTKGEDHDQEENLDILSPLSNYINQRKSFSYIEGANAMKRLIEDDDEEEEEKMDMLWENLNEEISNKIKTKTSCGKDHTKKVEYKCVKSLNLSKASKRPTLLVLIKVLKKVFL